MNEGAATVALAGRVIPPGLPALLIICEAHWEVRVNLQFNSSQGQWPRDFAEKVFLGTALAYINRAMHAEAHDLDVTTTSSGMQVGQSQLLPGQPADLDGYRRVYKARMVLGGEMLKGRIAAYVHEDRSQNFYPIPTTDWNLQVVEGIDLEPAASGNEAIQYRLPGSLISFLATANVNQTEVHGYVYLDRQNFVDLLAEINPRAYLPDRETSRLSKAAADHPNDASHWDVLSASVWIITGDDSLVSGTINYLTGKTGANSLTNRYDVLGTFLAQEIQLHHCACHRSICECLAAAQRSIQSAGANGKITGTGLASHGGDRQAIPPPAWLGKLVVEETVTLLPEQRDGTEWRKLLLNPAEVRLTWPPVMLRGPRPLAGSPAQRDAAASDLARQLDAEGIPIRAVTARLIASRWEKSFGNPPKKETVTSLMKGGVKGRPAQ